MSPLSTTHPAPFSQAWWHDFIANTENLTKAIVLKNCIDDKKRALYEAGILQVLRVFSLPETSRLGLRVYIDGIVLSESDTQEIYDSPPLPDESFIAWSKRVFGDQKFGLIVNLGEKLNPALTDDIALTIAPLLAQTGIPREGINYTVFIGNYDRTPLGIHHDRPGENVMHFHLGPASKSMYLWKSMPELQALMKEKGLKQNNVAGLIPYANEYRFDCGDLFFMPQGVCHIGAQEGFSIGLTVWQMNQSNTDSFKNIHGIISQNICRTEDLTLQPDKNNDVDDISGFEEVIRKHPLIDELAHLSYPELLRETYRDWRYRIHSNAGFRESAVASKELTVLSLDDELEVKQPYRMFVRKMPGNDTLIHIYVRGNKIQMKNFPCIENLVAKLNDGSRNSVRSLLDVLDKDWDTKIGLYILGELYRHHGIKKVGTD